ncbi:GNAT family N-acetyltransferase [Catenovulum agarivorans]|uniref:GNAT family N-acetyltransferase n=1 Tax=Catenovulum agarivorans TaxID=1172192 RepID=UPI0012FBC0C8|nr:GNAT family N-acetyltransferase [Catenovulum agarivorans]
MVNNQNLFVQQAWPNHIWAENFQPTTILTQGHHSFEGKVTAYLDNEENAQTTKSKLMLMSKVIDTTITLEQNAADVFDKIVQIKPNELSNWVKCCETAFSYQIEKNSTAQLFHNKNAQIWAYKIDQEIVATAISFKSNNTLGTHQVGVHPNYRGQGIARNFMLFLIAHAAQLGCTEVSLQASRLGMPMYQKLGFEKLICLNKRLA